MKTVLTVVGTGLVVHTMLRMFVYGEVSAANIVLLFLGLLLTIASLETK